jgi:hypothetical protein
MCNMFYNIVTCTVTNRCGLDWIFDLLTTYRLYYK